MIVRQLYTQLYWTKNIFCFEAQNNLIQTTRIEKVTQLNNNLLSDFGLIDARICVSEKEQPVPTTQKNWTLTWKVVTIWVNFVATIEAMGGFQLLDLIITELKSHMTCYNSIHLID